MVSDCYHIGMTDRTERIERLYMKEDQEAQEAEETAMNTEGREGVRRIQVYADVETKRRIELAATKHNLAVTSYCLEAIIQQLGEDEMLDEARIEIPVKPTAQTVDDHLITQMRTLRERIKARRGGKLLSADIVEQVRAERDEELQDIQGLQGL